MSERINGDGLEGDKGYQWSRTNAHGGAVQRIDANIPSAGAIRCPIQAPSVRERPLTPHVGTGGFVKKRYRPTSPLPSSLPDFSRQGAASTHGMASMRRSFDKAVSDAELPERLNLHDLRHTRITKWLAAGVDVVKVKESVGHRHLATTMRYMHLSKEHVRGMWEDPPAPAEEAG